MAIGLAVACVSALAVDWIRTWAVHRNLQDLPGERRLHETPTPRGGGLAIVALTVGSALFSLPWQARADRFPLLIVIACGAVLAAVSWLDDRGVLGRRSSALRLSVQVCAALVTTLVLGPVDVGWLPLVGSIELGAWAWMLSVLWVVGLTNAFNFMDGIDGLAGGQAIVAGLGWTALGAGAGLGPTMMLGVVAAAASAGFLVHNWPPARIFMGDVGSAFLGYVFAELTLLSASAHPVMPLAGLLVLWPFVFDTVFTFLRRVACGENVFTPHTSHLYQRLVKAGIPPARVNAVYLSLAACGTGTSPSPWSGRSPLPRLPAWPAFRWPARDCWRSCGDGRTRRERRT